MKKLFEYYNEIEEQNIEWLWYPYIPYGKVTILQGDPGDGKSTVAIQIAALLSTGRPMPDGWKVPKAQCVIYQCAEDGLADTIKPRLIAAKADCSRLVHIIEDDSGLVLSDRSIEQIIIDTGARLLIIDPLQAYLGNDVDMQSAVKMRNLFRSISEVASKTGCAVLLIGHMNKMHRGKNLYRGLGSIDIAAVARSVLMIVRDRNEPVRRYIFQIKNNLAGEGAPIGIRLGKDGPKWIGRCNVSLENVVNGVSERPTKLENAKQELIKMLSSGDMESKSIIQEMAGRGISKRTTQKAKGELDITAYRKQNCWYWKLNMEE